MARYKTLKKDFTKVDIGSMNSRITLDARAINFPQGDDYNYGIGLTKRLNLWAYVETVNGVTTFDSTNVERVVSHNFYIRFIPGVTFENWILYKNNLYDLIRAENYGEENKFYLLMANLRGDQTKPVNLA